MPRSTQFLYRAACALFLSAMIFTRTPAVAANNDAAIRAQMTALFPYSKILRIQRMPFHLYEVDFDDHLIYVDDTGHYLFSGHILSLDNMHDLTADREHKLYPSPFNTFPINLAITETHGNGKRKLAVFTDPNCPYCKKLERELAGLNNVTIYTFMLDILPGSPEKARTIWCAPNRLRAWQNQMLHNTLPNHATNCDTSGLADISALAKTLHISVTPTLYFPDGSHQIGVPTVAQLENLLNTSQAQ